MFLALRSMPFRLQSAGQKAGAIPIRMVLIATALPCLFWMGYAHLSSQDLLLEAFEDLIIQGHIAGAAFFSVYTIINFIGPLWENAPVYKVMYRPYQMGAWLLMFTTILCALALFYANNLTPYYQWMSARFSLEAELHAKEGRLDQAKGLLNLALGYSSRGNRQHYLMGIIETRERELGQALFHFSEAQEKNPSVAAGIQLIRNYRLRDKFFEAKDLAEDYWTTTGDPAYAFALGQLYLETGLLDSAAYYYRVAERGDQQMLPAVQTNLDAIIYKTQSEDLIEQRIEANRESNKLSINSSILDPNFDFLHLLPKAQNLADSFMIIHNYLHHEGPQLPTKSLSWLKGISDQWVFPYYKEKINDKLAQSYFSSGRISEMQQIEKQLHNPDVAQRSAYLYKAAYQALSFRKFSVARAYLERVDTASIRNLEPTLPLLLELETGLLRSEQLIENNPALYSSGLIPFLFNEMNNDSTYYWKVWFNAGKIDLEPLLTDLIEIKQTELRDKAFLEATYALFLAGQRNELRDWVFLENLVNRINPELLQQLRDDVLFLLGQKEQGRGLLWSTEEQERLQEFRSGSDSTYLSPHPAPHLWMEALVLQIADEWEARQNTTAAYELVLKAHEANPYSPAILKAYIRLCRLQNLNAFELRGLEKLRMLISPQQYNDFVENLPKRDTF
jgi:hypothetical protein